MAESELKTIVALKERQVTVKERATVPLTVVLRLTLKEAILLRTLLHMHIGGQTKETPRGHFTEISKALSAAGTPSMESLPYGTPPDLKNIMLESDREFMEQLDAAVTSWKDRGTVFSKTPID